MPRDEGVIYGGIVQGNGMGSGTITLTMKDKVCSGPFARGSSNDSFGLNQTYGTKGQYAVGTAVNSGGSSTVKSIFSCSDGTGLRCDFVGGGGTGTGVCVDTNGKVFDAVVM